MIESLPLVEEGFQRHHNFLVVDHESIAKMSQSELTEFLFAHFGIAILLVTKIQEDQKWEVWHYYIDSPIL